MKTKNSKKIIHSFASSYKTYVQGDFYAHTFVCLCGKKFGGWTPEEADLKLKSHIKKENI